MVHFPSACREKAMRAKELWERRPARTIWAAGAKAIYEVPCIARQNLAAGQKGAEEAAVSQAFVLSG